MKSVIPLSKEEVDPLIGNLLGDGSLLFNKKGQNGLPKPTSNANYVMTLKNKEYIYHLYTLFKDYCGSIPTNMKSFDSRPKKNKIYYSIKFNT